MLCSILRTPTLEQTLLRIENARTDIELKEALGQILVVERPMFEALLDSLVVNQRQVLKNVATGKSPYDLKMSAGSVRRSLEVLGRSDILERGDGGY